jgi:Ca-activated chloride channel family protein
MHSLHFLRPAWFLALLPLAALLALWWRRRGSGRSWQAVVDPGLLPHLLIASGRGRSAWVGAAVAIGAVLAVTALAGPTWSKLPQPVFRRESALVVLLDLSRSMDVADLQPSRLQLARFKLRDILARRREGDTALVVYAADPFVVTPLTSEVDNIVRQLPGLTTDLMPAQGSRADRAVAKAQALLRQAGAVRGDVLLITDGIDNDPPAALSAAVGKLTAAGYRLSVLGVGTTDGAPIPLADGGFFKDDTGAIVLPKLDQAPLAALAAEGHGIYRRMSAGDEDSGALTAFFNSGLPSRQSQQAAGMKSDQWRDAGPWLLVPLLPLAAWAFRRGYLLMLLLVMLLPIPHSAYALDWQDLWQRPDQRGAQALAAQRPAVAVRLFRDPQWRAAAHYRAGDYQAALKDLENQTGATAAYNRGNALARLGKYREAVSAYDEALKRNPHFKDAAYNRNLVEKWLQARKQSSANSGGTDRQQTGGGRQDNQPPDQEHANTQAKSMQSDKDRQQNPSAGKDPGGKAAQAQGRNAPSQSSPAGQEADTSSGQAGGETTARRAQAGQQDQGLSMNDNPGAAQDEAGRARSESEQATEQWLRRIPDDPGGLWRRKFLYQYKREYQSRAGEAKPW